MRQPLGEVARQIHEHLRRLEATQSLEPGGDQLDYPSARRMGAWVQIRYATHQPWYPLPRLQAEAYLLYLRDGGRRKHFGLPGLQKARKKSMVELEP